MTEPRISAVLFDVAGTLLVMDGIGDAYAQALAGVGVSIDPLTVRRRHALLSEATAFPDRPDSDFYAAFNATVLRSLGVPSTPRLVREVEERCRQLTWRPADGLSVLLTLPVPIGVVSNWDHTLEARLKPLGLPLQTIVASALAGVRKPDPRIFLEALGQLGLDARGVAYVGDSLRLDIEPAVELGLLPVLVDPLDLYPSHPGLRARGLAEVPELLGLDP